MVDAELVHVDGTVATLRAQVEIPVTPRLQRHLLRLDAQQQDRRAGKAQSAFRLIQTLQCGLVVSGRQRRAGVLQMPLDRRRLQRPGRQQAEQEKAGEALRAGGLREGSREGSLRPRAATVGGKVAAWPFRLDRRAQKSPRGEGLAGSLGLMDRL